MHHHRTNTRTLALLAAGGICCLLTGSAHAQRTVAKRAATTSTTGTTTSGSTTSGTSTSGAKKTCMTGTSSTGTSTGTTTTGTAAVLPTTSGNTAVTNTALPVSTVQAVRTSTNQLTVQYTGSTTGVKAVYIATLDTNEKPLQQNEITQAPVRASLSVASTARYYGVQVVYKNGSTKTLIATIK